MQQEDISTAVTVRSTGIRFGLIGALISIAYFVILNVAQINMSQGPWQYVGWVFTIILLVFAHKYYKENTDGFMSYGQGIGIAFWMGLISSVIASIFSYIYMKFIDQTFIENIKQQQIEAMEQKGMSEAQIEQAMSFSAAFMNPEVMLVMGLIFGVIGAVIIGLLVTIFTQKNNPQPGF
ncbi:MAG TPA: DUF4199 domain-containing protein [Ohtaekwangia sp.]|nr:DUF4199 domain-containing protein [Ohtaekwangia sp.]